MSGGRCVPGSVHSTTPRYAHPPPLRSICTTPISMGVKKHHHIRDHIRGEIAAELPIRDRTDRSVVLSNSRLSWRNDERAVSSILAHMIRRGPYVFERSDLPVGHPEYDKLASPLLGVEVTKKGTYALFP